MIYCKLLIGQTVKPYLRTSSKKTKRNDIYTTILQQFFYNFLFHTHIIFLFSLFLSLSLLFFTNRNRGNESCHGSCHLMIGHISLLKNKFKKLEKLATEQSSINTHHITLIFNTQNASTCMKNNGIIITLTSKCAMIIYNGLIIYQNFKIVFDCVFC